MFRGARTFIAGTIELLRQELNRFAGDVHDAFRDAGIVADRTRDDLTAAQSDIVTAQSAIAALQVIAATQEASALALGPSDPVTFTAADVTPQKSGTYLAIASMSGTISGGTDTVQVALMLDGANIAAVEVPATSDGWSGTVVTVVTVDPASAHSWGVEAATFDGLLNLSSGAGDARVVLVEL